MIAYFKWKNNLFMVIGGLIGFVLAVMNYRGFISQMAGYADVFVIALFVLIGVVVGRIASGWWATRTIRGLTALLYQQGKPEEFLQKFSPIVKKTPQTTVEYVDGSVKLAYAYEALGEFDKGLQIVNGLEPEKLKIHMLVGVSLTENQKMRLYLLTEDLENADAQLEKLKELKETAEGRASALAKNLGECIRLDESWIGFLKGEEFDAEYIREEAELANNRIHKSEMQLLLARMRYAQGQKEAAVSLLKEAAEAGEGLYAGKEAERLLADWNRK